jgi:hypothetical protein
VQRIRHVIAYYYLVILERRHGCAVLGALSRVLDGALLRAKLGRGRSSCGLVSRDPLAPGLSQANHPRTQCVCGFPKRARERNTMGRILGRPYCGYIGGSASGSA